MNKIAGFTGGYRFLSNFYPATVEMGGVFYPTLEHAYQAAKTALPKEREAIRKAATPALAKRLGKSLTIRPNWEEKKLEFMLILLRRKFKNSSTKLGDWLLATGDAYLEETNYWGDTFWGVCRGVGENHLGKILMQVREELRNERDRR